MITILATFVAAPGNEDEVAEALREYVPLALAEPGCTAFAVYRGAEEPRRFILVERYKDRDAVDAHVASAHYAEVARDRIRPLLESRRVEFLVDL